MLYRQNILKVLYISRLKEPAKLLRITRGPKPAECFLNTIEGRNRDQDLAQIRAITSNIKTHNKMKMRNV
jgi:hypothetical protein